MSDMEKVSFDVVYVGRSKNEVVLKRGKLYKVDAICKNGGNSSLHLKKYNGEFNSSEFVRVIKRKTPLMLVSHRIPKIGERFKAYTGKLDKDGNEEIVTSSEVIYVCSQSLIDKMMHKIRVLTKHLLNAGGSASLYELYY